MKRLNQKLISIFIETNNNQTAKSLVISLLIAAEDIYLSMNIISGVVVKIAFLDGRKGCEGKVRCWGAWCGQPQVFSHQNF